MEEDGNHVDRDEDCCSACGSHGEENEDSARFEEFDGEYTARGGSKDGVDLLDSEEDEEHAGADEETDYATAVPGVSYAAERESHDA